MTLPRQGGSRPIGQILAHDVLPALQDARRLPLRVFCLGSISPDDADAPRGHCFALGEVTFPEEAMRLAARVVSKGDYPGAVALPGFRPHLAVIEDRAHDLVLAGAIRAGVILWQPPVSSDAEARRIVTEASGLRGEAFAADGRGDRKVASTLRDRASLLEARLVDPVWREEAAALLSLPQAA
ncbi:MAG: hypothetical protein IOC87_06155 [Rhodobacter sp.]|nr:hypothetical protein [Rhodobacter sp.]MCA3549323.1 hypothetical protein [Rhodobacter sp.]MCA6262840.1 hypothetical protein [Phenylobacterium sp.]MCA6281667.1 hypothetical protein [Phenylobacterium sp.]MCA6317006.1 hypothetical protein [Phenylobacterium sp.]